MSEEQKLRIVIEGENTANKELDGLNKKLKSVDLSLNGLKVGISKIRSITNTFLASMKQSIDYIENLNLFEVAMKKNIDRAHEFTSALSEAFGMDKSEIIRYMGMFNSLAESMGNTQENAYRVSKALTQVAYDISSLYNISTASAMEKLQAGLVGQTKPLRTVGIDTTYQTLQQYLAELGVDTMVKKLSQADKQLLRTIAILRQSENAWGDMGKTIETPANQLRVFSAQVTKLGRAIGNVFIGLFGKILPYINGFVMVLYESINAFARLVGFELPDYNKDRKYSSIADDLDDANDSAKDLKKSLGLLKFDELNNTNTNKGNGTNYTAGSYGDLLGGEIDSIMTEYDSKMSSVKMKATQIRDAIMEWLGFTKEVDSTTGEVTFKLKDGWTNLKKILTIIKVIIAVAVINKIIKLVEGFKLFVSTIGSNGGVISSLKDLGLYMKIGTEQYGSLAKGITAGTQAWMEQLSTVTKVVVGVAGLIASYQLAESSMKSLNEQGEWTTSSILQMAGSFASATASGALMGSTFGPLGTVIGGITGFLFSLVSATINYKNEAEKLYDTSVKNNSSMKEYISTLQESRNAIQETLNSNLAQIGYTEKLVAELNNLVDANGKVKAGYEDRVSFILNELNSAYGTNYELINGEILQYKDLNAKIKDVINTKKSEAILNANEQNYSKAIQEQLTLWKKKEDALKDVEKAQQKVNEKNLEFEEILQNTPINLQDVAIRNWNTELGKLKDALNVTKDTYNGYASEWKKNSDIIIYYENLQEATITGNKKKIQEAISNLTKTYETEKGSQVATMSEQIKAESELANRRLEILKQNGIDINGEIRTQLQSGIEALAENLTEQTATLSKLTPDVVEAWRTLASTNSKVFIEEVNKLPLELQNSLKDQLGATGTTLGEAFGSGMSNAMKVDPKPLSDSWNNTISRLYGTVSKFAGSVLKSIIGVDITLPSLSSLKMSGLKDGGVITQPMLYNGVLTGENYRKEAIVPLQNSKVVDNFSARISDNILSAISKISEQPIVNQIYVDADKVTESVNKKSIQYNNMFGKSVK